MLKILLSAAIILALGASPAVGQQVTADVRTWSGQTFTISDPTFEIFYTIMPSVTTALGGGGGYAPVAGAPGVGGAPGMVPAPRGGDLAQPPTNIGIGSVGFQSGTASLAASGTLLPEGVPSKQGRRQQDSVRLSREGVEVHVPVANLSSLTFSRALVQRSSLPPYASLTHFRHGATAVLADGSQIQGDYVNMGTGVLRGSTPQGIVDIPWDEIESVRYRR